MEENTGRPVRPERCLSLKRKKKIVAKHQKTNKQTIHTTQTNKPYIPQIYKTNRKDDARKK